MTAFVLGNGVSRRDIDVNLLLGHGSVYGCNAIYREYIPTVLVATDPGITKEIKSTGYHLRNRFYTRRGHATDGALLVPDEYHGFSSGPIAVALAARDGHDRIYLLGFDLGPDSQGQFNNIYAGSDHYKPQGALPTYTGNWVRQILTVAQDHPRTNFIRIHGPTTAVISEFSQAPNLEIMTIAAFRERINTSKDL